MTFTHALSTNNYGTAKFIVSASSANGTHTTIASAITAASSGDTIFIRPGIYTENITLKAGVNLTAFAGDGLTSSFVSSVTPNVIILGTVTASYTGSVTLNGFQLKTNGAAALATSGVNTGTLQLNNCSVFANDSTGMTFNAASLNTSFYNCTFASTSTNLLFAVTTGPIVFQSCHFTLSTTATASTIAASNVGFQNCVLSSLFITTSTGGSVNAENCFWTTGNNTSLTTAGTGISTISGCYLQSGSGSTISIGAGTQVGLYSSSIQSSNTNAITGAGTLNYGGVVFTGSSITINTSTQNPIPWPVKQGGTGLSATTANQLLYSSSTNTIAGLATANNAILATDGSGVPSITTSSGNWLNTTRTAFLGILSGQDNNVTGDGTTYTLGAVTALTKTFDQGTNLTTAGVFTAAATGIYQFNIILTLRGVLIAHTAGVLNLVTTARTYSILFNPFNYANATADERIHLSTLANMTATDTATITVTVSNGTKVVAVGASTWYSGFLVC